MDRRTDNDTPFWAALAFHPKIGPMSFRKLSAHFGSMAYVWEANKNDLAKVGLEENLFSAVLEAKTKYDPEKVMHKLKSLDIAPITPKSLLYPKILREIPDPPGVLFVRGTLYQDELSIAVVGSRKYTFYGKQVVEEIVPPLVALKLSIVSGLALGIDSIAHLTTLSCGGRTIAILGSGLDRIYPASHGDIAKKILDQGGALISEFPPGRPSYPSNFPVRNRIIAALTLGTVVVEAAADSGSLLTAKAALDYNREVFAVPGDIFRSTSQGTNNLIKMGAKLVTGVDDILIELNIPKRQRAAKARQIIPDNPTEEKILPILRDEPLHINTLVKLSKMDIKEIGSALMLMEMKGKVKNVGGNHYVKVNR